jgi:hypothetical protein
MKQLIAKMGQSSTIQIKHKGNKSRRQQGQLSASRSWEIGSSGYAKGEQAATTTETKVSRPTLAYTAWEAT